MQQFLGFVSGAYFTQLVVTSTPPTDRVVTPIDGNPENWPSTRKYKKNREIGKNEKERECSRLREAHTRVRSAPLHATGACTRMCTVMSSVCVVRFAEMLNDDANDDYYYSTTTTEPRGVCRGYPSS